MTISRPAMQCVCATVGYQHHLWNSDYYPEECPEEWRLAYYMNDFRAVFLPQDQWCGYSEQIKEIAEELDEGFDLVLEWPDLQGPERTQVQLASLGPVAGNVACIVVNAPPQSAFDPIQRDALTQIAEQHTVNIASDLGQDKTRSLSDVADLNRVWSSGQTLSWIPGSRYQVVRLPCMELRQIRSVLDALRPMLEGDIRCGLFIEPSPLSTQRALEARTLIELMGLS